MKKTIIIMALLFCAVNASSFEYLPSSVKSMEVTITSEATGTFYGTITAGDKLEILFLSPQNSSIISMEEYMEIGNEKITPRHTERNGLRYADYKINDIYKYAEDNTFRIVRKIRAKSSTETGIGKDYNLSDGINEFTEFKKATPYIESDDPELISKTELEFKSDSEIETIREITEWVNNSIEYDFDNYYNVVNSAKETYGTRAGVCDEFANLTAAFLRIRGIPTRYVSGISYDGERFGAHGWLEAYLPKTGWIGVDSTYGEAGFVDGAHFPMAKAADSNEISDLVITSTSRKTISVESKLLPPEVEINSVEFFEGLTDVNLLKKDEVKTGESFEIKADVKNISDKSTIIPVELVIIQADEWSFVAMTFDVPTQTMRCYIFNEGNVYKNTTSVTQIYKNTNNLRMTGQGSNNVNGTVDELMMFDRALTESELKVLARG